MLGVKRVVGITGSDEKCAWVKNVLGADEAANYKSATFTEDLKKATQDRIDGFVDSLLWLDIYSEIMALRRFLDIAGGKILEEVMMQMSAHGIVCLCGGVSGESSPKL